MDLLLALDDRFQTGTVEGPELAPVARLLAAGGIVVRGDSAFERYRTPRPEPTEALYASGVAGLAAPVSFGTPAPNDAAVAGLDEWALADPAVGSPVAPVQLVAVDGAPRRRPSARARPRRSWSTATARAWSTPPPPGCSTGHAPCCRRPRSHRRPLAAAIPPGAALVVTDTNRKRAEQWRGSQDTTGFTEDAGAGVLVADEADNRLPVFPAAGTDAGPSPSSAAAPVQASAYGEPNAYRPEDRPARPSTATPPRPGASATAPR